MSVAGVGSVVTARCGDAPTSPPWPQPKSLAAAPLVIFKQALKRGELFFEPLGNVIRVEDGELYRVHGKTSKCFRLNALLRAQLLARK